MTTPPRGDYNVRSELIHHQKQNERLLAGCAMINSAQVAQDCAWLSPDILIDPEVKPFWKAFLESHDAIKAANETNNLLHSTEWMQHVPSSLYYGDYAQAIAEDHFYYTTLEHVGKIVGKIATKDQHGILEEVDAIRNLRMDGACEGLSAEQVGVAFEKSIDEGFHVVLTHIPALDNLVGGLFAKELVAVAARPGVGKTTLLTQIARNAAREGKKVGFFTLEMSAEQLWAKMACPRAEISWTDVRSGAVTKDKLTALKFASQELRRMYAKNLILIEDTFTLARIHQTCTYHHFDLVLIDQLSEIRQTNQSEKKVDWYGRCIKYLRDYIAKDLDVPVALAVAINRGPEGREDKHPTIADTRDSGEIEQRSDAVWLCYREDMYLPKNPTQDTVAFEVTTGKNRQGNAGGNAILKYNLTEQWFR